MEVQEKSREHGLARIVDDTGNAFAIGAIGGSAFHFIKGSRNSPSGRRLVGGAQAVSMNAARLGGSFGSYGALFSAFEYTTIRIRNKEDRWNAIIAGTATGGLLSIRQGIAAASTSAILGGVLLALLRRNA
ncbi:unnamed protein product [Arabis nemorensis]|uniref:Uncharacterized protein n=1 Tax=Arabis nemorensis TaxID=586526 RepID=A0A565CKU8_9BRAS|nr:unnamed protein product [Arabis nemorensis]